MQKAKLVADWFLAGGGGEGVDKALGMPGWALAATLARSHRGVGPRYGRPPPMIRYSLGGRDDGPGPCGIQAQTGNEEEDDDENNDDDEREEKSQEKPE